MTSARSDPVRKISKVFFYVVDWIRDKPNTQLRMQLVNLDDLNETSVPLGYRIRTYRKGDEESWIRIVRTSFEQHLSASIMNEILNSKGFDPEGLFFLTQKDEPVGTVCSLRRSVDRSEVGYIHMLAVTPEHQGKRLGHILTLAALHYFRNRGLKKVVLDTDDYRLPAIKTYLDLGFEPVYLGRSHKNRWKMVFENLRRRNSD
jgi:mycothiol synthase